MDSIAGGSECPVLASPPLIPFPSASLPASFLSCPASLPPPFSSSFPLLHTFSLSCPSSFVSCLLSTPLCLSPSCTAPVGVWLFPNIALPPRSAQPACAVKAVARLQARTGTSSGLEITASAPGAPSSMRKVGTWQGTGALGGHRAVVPGS